MENGLTALIISDARVGHQSQSEAFCKLKGLNYDVLNVSYRFKILKILSYLLDFARIYVKIFTADKPPRSHYDIVVSAGSTTYYANKFFAQKFCAKNVALMQPKGFGKDFSLIISTLHDCDGKILNSPNIETDQNKLEILEKTEQSIAKNSPKKGQTLNQNLRHIALEVGLNFLTPTNYYIPKKPSIAFIIGGDNKIFKMQPNILEQIAQIRENFKGYEVAITTSPRTPDHVKQALLAQNFDFFVLFERDQINPIYDFVHRCEFVFITQDSVSMISEAVCNGTASVVVLPLKNQKPNNKFQKFLEILQQKNLVQLYKQSTIFSHTHKLNLQEIIKNISF